MLGFSNKTFVFLFINIDKNLRGHMIVQPFSLQTLQKFSLINVATRGYFLKGILSSKIIKVQDASCCLYWKFSLLILRVNEQNNKMNKILVINLLVMLTGISRRRQRVWYCNSLVAFLTAFSKSWSNNLWSIFDKFGKLWVLHGNQAVRLFRYLGEFLQFQFLYQNFPHSSIW